MPKRSKEPARVLLVDDDPVVLETLAAILEDEFQIETAHSLRTGLQKLASDGPYDVVVTDYELRDGTGEGILRWIADNMGKRTAGIVVTGHPDYREVRQLQREVRFLVLFKPVDPNELLTWVRHEAGLSRLHRSISRRGGAGVERGEAANGVG